MLKGAVGSRYAQALFDIAMQQNKLDQLEKELLAVKKVVADSRELQKVLYHPQVTPEEKKRVIKDIFTDKISKITANFLNLLIDHRREIYLEDIASFFVNLANRARNLVEVYATSAIELNNEEKKKIQDAMVKITRKKVRVYYTVDSNLLGGVVIRIGDKVIDGSIRTKLVNMREYLRQTS